jgi:hypothetical protein
MLKELESVVSEIKYNVTTPNTVMGVSRSGQQQFNKWTEKFTRTYTMQFRFREYIYTANPTPTTGSV